MRDADRWTGADRSLFQLDELGAGVGDSLIVVTIFLDGGSRPRKSPGPGEEVSLAVIAAGINLLEGRIEHAVGAFWKTACRGNCWAGSD